MNQLRKTIAGTTSRMNEMRADTLQQAKDMAAAAQSVDPTAKQTAATPTKTNDPNDPGDLAGKGQVQRIVGGNVDVNLETGKAALSLDVAPAQGGELT